MTYVDLRPDGVRLVEVLLEDGRWVTGELEAYRRVDGVWQGWVRWHEAIGAQYIAWLGQDRIRPVP